MDFVGRAYGLYFEFLRENPGYVRAFELGHCPDEIFFHTIILKSLYGTDIQPCLIYTDWGIEGAFSPREICEENFPFLENNYTFPFARKHSGGNSGLLERIDEHLGISVGQYFLLDDLIAHTVIAQYRFWANSDNNETVCKVVVI